MQQILQKRIAALQKKKIKQKMKQATPGIMQFNGRSYEQDRAVN
jgi:hypothetical protein